MKTICIIFGGQSSEHEVSCMSAGSVIENIDREKWNVITLAILKDGRQFLYLGDVKKIADASFKDDAENLVPAIISPCPAHHGIMVIDKAKSTFKIEHVDVFLPIVHGENCEDGNLQGLLTLSGVAYVGSDAGASALAMDKDATKSLLERLGVRVAKWICIKKNGDYSKDFEKAEKTLSYPMFVKPSRTGSSVGVSKVTTREELEKAVSLALTFDSKVLVEEYVKGSEIETAVLDTQDKRVVSCPGEIVPGSEFYDYDTKYTNDTTSYYIPARLDDDVAEKVRSLALYIFEALGCRGLARVDFFVSGKDIVFNEINSLPGFTKISMYPKLMRAVGYEYSRLLDELIEFSLN